MGACHEFAYRCPELHSFVVRYALFARTKTDVLVMKNGDRLTGEIKGLDEGVLYVSFDYILGTSSVQWSKVAYLESKQLFIVKTADGSVYTGTLSTAETEDKRPVKIEVIESPQKQTVLPRKEIVKMGQTSDKFLAALQRRHRTPASSTPRAIRPRSTASAPTLTTCASAGRAMPATAPLFRPAAAPTRPPRGIN